MTKTVESIFYHLLKIDGFRLMIDGAKRRFRFVGDDLRMAVIFYIN